MKFCTVINCMDGRVQLPVINYLKERFNAEYVDSITAAGPNKLLSESKNSEGLETILKHLEISIEKHHSEGIAITGHYDCAGNPAEKEEQIRHIKQSIKFLLDLYPDNSIIGLWIDSSWQVQEITS